MDSFNSRDFTLNPIYNLNFDKLMKFCSTGKLQYSVNAAILFTQSNVTLSFSTKMSIIN